MERTASLPIELCHCWPQPGDIVWREQIHPYAVTAVSDESIQLRRPRFFERVRIWFAQLTTVPPVIC